MIKKIMEKTDFRFWSFYIFLFAFISCLSITEKTTAQSSDSVSSGKKSVALEDSQEVSLNNSEDEIKRGERFFMGLLPFNRKYESCVSCHNLTPVDTLNWNPSAMAIALKKINAMRIL